MLAANEGLTADDLAESRGLTGARRLSGGFAGLGTILGGANGAAAGNDPVFNNETSADGLAELASLVGEGCIKAWREILATGLTGANGAAVGFSFAYRQGKARYRWEERLRRSANILEWVFGATAGAVYRSYLDSSHGGRRVRCPPQAAIGAGCDRSADTIAHHLPLLRALGLVETQYRSGRNIGADGRRFAPGGRRLADRVIVRAFPLGLIEAAEVYVARRRGVPLETLLQFEPQVLYALRERQAAALAIVDRAGTPEAAPIAWRPPMTAKLASVCRRLVDTARQACGPMAARVFEVILGATDGGLKTTRIGQQELGNRCGVTREYANQQVRLLREKGFLVTFRQAFDGKRYRDQVRVILSEAELAAREAEALRERRERRAAARARTAGTFRARLAARLRSVFDDTARRRQESQASQELRVGRVPPGDELAGPWQAVGGAMCELLSGGRTQKEKLETPASSGSGATVAPARPPPLQAAETHPKIERKAMAEAAEGRSFPNRCDLSTSLERFRAAFAAGRARKAAEAKPTRTAEDAQARSRAAELAERRTNALAAADSLESGGVLHAAGIIAYAVTRSVERSSEIARAKLKAKLAREAAEGAAGKKG
ncbi:hypothetical protein FB008_1383 [Sinorhizobium medicae]|uniref:hypothetical protein n=1 Tax=Sinorhizobium medicae TaxID=110321 RepID=UPI0011A8A150|nr:hypothetical protein [Sinorhizobium medicae]TWA44243.1 hypothetical protein FB008_1383 [Sinorhizobium medicae]